jgi:hypothetical protein
LFFKNTLFQQIKMNLRIVSGGADCLKLNCCFTGRKTAQLAAGAYANITEQTASVFMRVDGYEKVCRSLIIFSFAMDD